MMNVIIERLKNNGKFQYIVSYLMSFITLGINILLFDSIRMTIATALIYSGISPWSWNAILIGFIILLGFGAVILIFLSQHLYEKDLKNGWLFKKFLMITGTQMVIYLVCCVVLYILSPLYRTSPIASRMAVSAVIAVISFILYYREIKRIT